MHQGPPGARPVAPSPLLTGHPPRRPAAYALEGRAHQAQPQGAGLPQTGRLPAHSPRPIGHEAAQRPPHAAHH